MSLDEIHAWLEQYPGVMVEITGGEPLLQPAVLPLMEQLLGRGRQVLLETGGSLSIKGVPDRVGVIMDLKCPGSGMEHGNEPDNLDLLRTRAGRGSRDEIKFVLSSIEDFNWAAETVRNHGLTDLVPVLFSPVTSRLNPAELAQLILKEQLPVRLQLQLHTRLWPDRQRGV